MHTIVREVLRLRERKRGNDEITNGEEGDNWENALKIQIPDPTPTPSASKGEINLDAIV